MSEYGYIPEAPEQSFGNNKGIFTPKDIYDLTRADKYTNYGQLELIETQSITSGTVMDFTEIKEDIYNVHFMTFQSTTGGGTSSTNAFIRLYENGVLETASVYQRAMQYGRIVGGFGEAISTAISGMDTSCEIFNNPADAGGSYVYLYNLGDSTKYSFSTSHGTQTVQNNYRMQFTSNVLPQASTVDGIRIYQKNVNAGDFNDLTVSLYGIKEYS